MAELTSALLHMADVEIKNGIRIELLTLEELLKYLEERGELGAREFLYCQSKLRDVVKNLKRLERVTNESPGHP